MKIPTSPDAYLYLFARAMPDPAAAAHHLSAAVSLVQTAMAALCDDEPDNARRATAALTLVLGALTLMAKDFDRAAQWLASSSLAHGGGA